MSKEEQDFFTRELEKMDWGEPVAGEAEEGGAMEQGWAGPLQLEGW